MAKSNLINLTDNVSFMETDAIRALKAELEKGMDSMKQERLYTIDEAWAEIDSI